MNRIFLDLELEQPNTNSQTPDSLLSEEKIIQVGWVVYNPKMDQVLKQSCYEVNIGVPLSKFIKKLTGISDEAIANGTTLEEIYSILVQDIETYNTSRIVGQWGGGDMDCLRKELPTDIGWPFGRSGLNIKHLYQTYAEANGLNHSGGLAKCLRRLNISWSGGQKHNALADALNTAKIYKKLMLSMKQSDVDEN